MRRKFTVLMLGEVLTAVAMFNLARSQEHKHETPSVQKELSDTKNAPTSQAQGTKCCEDMEKMGGMKSDMPMKGEMTEDMKAKMAKMKAMKEKMAEQMGEQGMKLKMPDVKVEPGHAPGAEHKH